MKASYHLPTGKLRAEKVTAPPISRTARYNTPRTLVVVAVIVVITMVMIRQVVIQIFLRFVLMRASLLDLRLLTSGRTELPIFDVLAQFSPVMSNIALVLADRVGFVAHVFLVLRVHDRKDQ